MSNQMYPMDDFLFPAVQRKRNQPGHYVGAGFFYRETGASLLMKGYFTNVRCKGWYPSELILIR